MLVCKYESNNIANLKALIFIIDKKSIYKNK